MGRRRRHTVAAVIADGVAPFELAVGCEVFGIDRSELVDPWYRFLVCASTPGPTRTSVGFTIDTPYGLEEVRRADTVIVPAWGVTAQDVPGELVDALRAAHRRGARLLSVCSGAFVLAATGLLDGRRATTHWMYTDLLAQRHPEIDVDPRVLYVDEGDVMTSAGTAAGIDLCLHVVRLDHGAEVANAVARRMVVPPHRDGGQAQFVEAPVAPSAGDDPLATTLGWMLEHLDRPLTVDDLAERSHMSPRHFARRFRAVTGTTPHQWLLSQRVLLATRLLETTDEPVELVAYRCGMGTAANLRAHFQRAVGTSPQSYRRTFRRDEAV
ncbi:MAG TPA: helix-turn-helix domain-containing protein [Acidimicrobiales bacterium]|nr:helix-turn-helix domain-containing protein [Acidimicrobiales bacterium]